MATKTTNISLLFFIVCVCVFWSSAAAQTSCTKTLMTLSPCLNYVTGNSSSPSSSCCTQLSNVVSSQPQCLCLLLNGTASSYGFNINQTLALELPKTCSVETPPTSKCNAATANAPSTSSDTKQIPPANIPSGSKTVASNNGADIVKAPCNILVFLLFAAASSYLAGL